MPPRIATRSREPAPNGAPLPLSARIAAPLDAVEARVAAWTEGYAPLSGIPDEFIGADGARRPHWARMLDLLASLGPDDVSQRFAAADRRIRNRGMSYRVQGETSERVWPLSRMPLLIPEAECREIARGVAQRAERLSRLRTRDARRQAAGQAVAAPVRRRYRAGTRRALVGLGRPHAGAFRFGLRAGESLGRFPGLPVPLSRDERRAAPALLPRIARRAEGERRALGAADRNIYARPVERDLFRAGLSRALSRLSAGGGR